MQALILDLNFWHRSFLTTIMVDHYPLFVFLHAVILMFIMIIMFAIIMLCSFGISTEASAPTVLFIDHIINLKTIML